MNDAEVLDRLADHYQDAVLAVPVAQVVARGRAIRRRRTRVRATLVGAALLIPVGGVSAAAVGALPVGLSSAFVWSHDSPGVNPADAALVATAAGPNGQRLEIWVATGTGGDQCVSRLLVPADQPTTASYDASMSGGASCSFSSSEGPPSFGTNGGWGMGSDSIVTFAYSAGGATAARVRLPSGETVAASVSNGWVFGVFTASGPGIATLTGNDASGDQVGHLALELP